MNFNRNKLLFSFTFLLVAALAGVLLRLQFMHPIGMIKYKYLLHTHSHIALLGWVFNALFLGLTHSFLSESPDLKKSYHRLFILFQVTYIGMLASFPVQGYGVVSIFFSTLFLFVSYAFSYRLYNDVNSTHPLNHVSVRFVKAALFYLVLSSLGPWTLGLIMVTGNSDSQWYPLSIYFYLHFLYNGFFVFAIAGLIFKMLEKEGVIINEKKSKLIFMLMHVSCLPAFLLSTLWLSPPAELHVAGGIAALLQVFALFLFSGIIYENREVLTHVFSKKTRILFVIAGAAYTIKVIMQVASAFPSLAMMAFYTQRFTIIGYLHLVMLGFVTTFLMAYFIYIKKFTFENKGSVLGAGLFILGFLFSETVLFTQGVLTFNFHTSIEYYSETMFYTSLLMSFGLIVFFIFQTAFTSKHLNA